MQVTALNNTAPVAANDSGSTGKGAALTISVLAIDTDADGDSLSVTAPVQPANGTVEVHANSPLRP